MTGRTEASSTLMSSRRFKMGICKMVVERQRDARLEAVRMALPGTDGARISDGVILQQPQEGTDQEADLQKPRAADERCGRLHQSLLQSNPPPLGPVLA